MLKFSPVANILFFYPNQCFRLEISYRKRVGRGGNHGLPHLEQRVLFKIKSQFKVLLPLPREGYSFSPKARMKKTLEQDHKLRASFDPELAY